MARHLGENPRPQASDAGVSSTACPYKTNVDGKDNWDLVDINAADELLEHTVMKTNFM